MNRAHEGARQNLSVHLAQRAGVHLPFTVGGEFLELRHELRTPPFDRVRAVRRVRPGHHGQGQRDAPQLDQIMSELKQCAAHVGPNELLDGASEQTRQLVFIQAKRRAEQRLLRLEAMKQRALGHPRALGDLERGGANAALEKNLARDRE